VIGFLAEKANLIARLARDDSEIEKSQQLRYQVFYQEMSALPDEQTLQSHRDVDRFDEVCDHLLVVRKSEHQPENRLMLDDGELVGTYRLLRQEIAEQNFGFYTQQEYDLAELIRRHGNLSFLELGRSCVLAPFRTKPVVELLWQGIWNYVRMHRLDVMVGCASLSGTDLTRLKYPISFLHHNFQPPGDWQVVAHPHCRTKMKLLDADLIDQREALRQLPPLIKGYLRLGAFIGDGAVVDHQFGTTDVLIILPVSVINPRYFSRFGAPGKIGDPSLG
jgi:putative hemolysin